MSTLTVHHKIGGRYVHHHWALSRVNVNAQARVRYVGAPCYAVGIVEMVTVSFEPTDARAEALPGEDLLEVANRCGALVPTGCLHGSCGICEVELNKYHKDGSAGAPTLVRACITKIPKGFSRVEIKEVQDPIWGQDGWDT